MDGSDFEKNKPQRCKIGIRNDKNEVKTIYYGDHIRTWTVISKKKKKGLHLVFSFSNQRAARGVNSFPDLALRVKSLPTLALNV